MNKLLITTATVAVLAIGCSKEPPTRPESGMEIPQNNIFHQIDLNNGEVMESFNQADFKGNSGVASNNKSANSATGHFTTGATTVSFSGVRNNGGLNGQIQFKGLFDFHMKTVCLEIVGNQAMLAGQITSVKSTPEGNGSPASSIC